LSISTNKWIGVIFISSGIVGILLSDFFESTTLAFIGLSLTFWGCLFLLVQSERYVKSEVMDHMSSSSLLAIDQMITDSNAQGKPIYIPVMKESYLPIHIGTKDEFVYIPKRDEKDETTIEQAFIRNQQGLRLVPPGLSLVNLIEQKTKLSFHNIDFNSLTETLPPVITQELEIAHEFKISLEENNVRVQIVKPVCEDLCREVYKMQKICPHVGCPLCSSIACILTRVTNKPITIEKCSIKKNIIETWYHII
jgi:hypothetical protein